MVTAFYTQSYWLVPLISSRIEPLGFEFHAQRVEWFPEWPLRVKAEQVVISYRDGKEPREMLRGPLIEIEMQGSIWSSNVWQIAKVNAQIDQINWAAHRIAQRSIASSNQHSSDRGISPEANQFSLIEYQFQLSRLVVYSSKPNTESITYLLNMKTPWVRGPFTEWSQIQKGLFPGQISFNR